MKFLVLLVLVCAVSSTVGEEAMPCDPATCTGNECRCSSTESPGLAEDIALFDQPHFVVLSFDDGVTVTNYPFYEKLGERTNANGCKIKMSFFVSHENSDYSLVNELYRKGHEIAVHSVTHKADVQNYWRKLTQEQWSKEILDQKYMIEKYAKIPAAKIRGFRAPFLEVGGNNMYRALSEAGFEYDCSWASLKYTPWFVDGEEINGALWPYTLDYESIQDQTVGTKPNASIPGMWVAPMTDLQDFRGVECSMLDACQGNGTELEQSPDAVFELLKFNFKYHLNKRTPFGIYTHHSWFLTDQANNNTVKQDGFNKFLDYLKGYPNVFLVSVHQLMDWVKNPVPYQDLETLDSFNCNAAELPDNCENIKTCTYNEPLPIEPKTVVMTACIDEPECPVYYPWINNTDGNNPYP